MARKKIRSRRRHRMSDKSKCRVCDKVASMQCSRCKKVHYCGVEHQRGHWKAHKPDCKGLYEVRINYQEPAPSKTF